MHSVEYRGRFAPSPTGPLHFGSLIAAVGSYLDARHHHGTWLVRMEDLDTPRCSQAAADDILRTLEAFNLFWDEAVVYQSKRTDAYESALLALNKSGMTYPCTCTRKEIADSALHGIEGPVYPGTCRHGKLQHRSAHAWRVRTDCGNPALPRIGFMDLACGAYAQALEKDIGDFVVKRADGLFAYQLAVVVDDAMQGISHVVRGADLLASTPRQLHLQTLLNFPAPQYLHLPVATNAAGEKLSKQTQAPALDVSRGSDLLFAALHFLGQKPPAELAAWQTCEILDWAIANWNRQALAAGSFPNTRPLNLQ